MNKNTESSTQNTRPAQHLNLNLQAKAGIIKEVRAQSTVQLHALLEGLFLNMSDSLFEGMEMVQDKALLSRHFNVMRELKTGYSQLQEGFDDQMTSAWNALLLEETLPMLQSLEGNPGQIMSSLSHRASDRYALLLAIFAEHIETLLGQSAPCHPLAPDSLYLSFWLSTETLNLDIEERLLIVPLFSRFVTDNLGLVVAQANQLVVDQLPEECA